MTPSALNTASSATMDLSSCKHSEQVHREMPVTPEPLLNCQCRCYMNYTCMHMPSLCVLHRQNIQGRHDLEGQFSLKRQSESSREAVLHWQLVSLSDAPSWLHQCPCWQLSPRSPQISCNTRSGIKRSCLPQHYFDSCSTCFAGHRLQHMLQCTAQPRCPAAHCAL
jgi:hypothetical protein